MHGLSSTLPPSFFRYVFTFSLFSVPPKFVVPHRSELAKWNCARRWIGEADKHDFQGMLTGDIIQSACGIPDF